MTRIKYYLFLLAVLALGLSSCSKDQAYQYALPADAYSVCSFDLKSMAKKAGVANSKYGELQKHFTEMLSDSEEAEAYYKELIQNPSKSGIDLKSPVFLFSNEENSSSRPRVRTSRSTATTARSRRATASATST